MNFNFFDKKINITIPGMIDYFFINQYFIFLNKNKPEFFNKNYKISSVTASVSHSPWNSYRKNKYIDFKLLKKIYSFYKKNNIAINILFENKTIENDDLHDIYSNLILKLFDEKNNSITIYSEKLKEYIKKNYKNYRIIKLSDKNEKNSYIEIIDKHNNYQILKKIKNKKTIFIKLNPICNSTCPTYDIHRLYIENEQKNFYKPSQEFICPLKKSLCFYDLIQNENFITNEEIKKYIEIGFNNFKIDENYICKNTNANYCIIDTIESYIYYLIKPEFQSLIRKVVIKKYIEQLKKGMEIKKHE